MTIVSTPDSAGAALSQDRFIARIADDDFDFREVHFNDRKVTGSQIAEAAGAHPIDDFIILQQLESLDLETVRPNELVDLHSPARLFVIRGSGTDKFVVDGIRLEWPRKDISGLSIKRLIGRDEDDIELVLELSETPDKVIDDDDVVRIGAPGVERFNTRPAKGHVTIVIDGEPYEAPKRVMTPNEMIVGATGKDPAINHLVRITKQGRISYEGKGNDPIRLRNGMKFQVISTGPTPVSDPNFTPGVTTFIGGLKLLGFKPELLAGKSDHVTFEYTVESGKFQGKTVRLGFVVPTDFPMTPPSGPYVTPEVHSIKPDGAHPLGGVHKEQARPWDQATGAAWQYWSRPFPDWGTSKRTVATYMSHVWKLWDSQ